MQTLIKMREFHQIQTLIYILNVCKLCLNGTSGIETGNLLRRIARSAFGDSDPSVRSPAERKGTSLSGTWLQYEFNCCANQHVWIRNRSTDINQLLDLPQHVFKPLSICHDLTERNLILASVISLLCSFVHSCQSIPLTCSTAYMAHDPNIATCEYHAIYDTPSCCLKGG